MQIQPYLFFNGHCEEAIEFYRRAVGADVTMLMRYKDSPEKSTMAPPGSDNKIMHSSFRVGDTTVMASDGECLGELDFKGFALSLTVPDETEAEQVFALLGDGGKVQMPLTNTFFSPRFGMVEDRFGVSWMVMAEP